MGARGRILAVIFLFCAILPLLSSAQMIPNPLDRILGKRGIIGSNGFYSSVEKDRENGRNGGLSDTMDYLRRMKEERKRLQKEEMKKMKEKRGFFEDLVKPVEDKPEPVKDLVKPVEDKPAVEPVKDQVKPVENKPAAEPVNDQVKPVENKPAVEPVNDQVKPVEDKPATEKVQAGLRVGYYEKTCPQAENIVRQAMEEILERNVKIGPSLVRLFFHDCFVTGCDASILLDKTPTGETVEKEAGANAQNVRGFEEIQEIKTRLEAACPGVVSCADVLAIANRDALNQTGVPRYDVPLGRRDRPVSLAKNVDGNIPLPETPVQEITQTFAKKGLTFEELIVLIGAHSIGEAHCRNVAARFADPEKRKEISPRYLDTLHVHLLCVDPDQTLPFDRLSQNLMDAFFYKELLARETLIESDHNLAKDVNGNALMQQFANDEVGWLAKFTQAIIKLGNIEVLTGDQGEIRKQCNAFN